MNQAGIGIGEARERARQGPGRAEGRGVLGWRLRVVPPSHPSADIEVVVSLLGVFAIVLLAFVPLDWVVPWLGGCRFHDVTGYPCPTCGITRGLLHVAHGEILEGLRDNPVLVGGVLALMAYTPAAAVMWWRRWPRPRMTTTSRRAAWAWRLVALVAVLGNWAFLVWDGR